MTEPVFSTPRRARQRSSLGSVTSNSNRSSRRGSSLLGSGTESELTSNGTQILHAGITRSGRALALQVLGVYRYVADPVLKRVLPPRAAEALEWDVFDLVVSDGQMKMKAMLSPALNHLVWRGLVGELDIVEIDDYEILTIRDHDDDDDDDGRRTAPSRSVCMIHELTPRAPAAVNSQADDEQQHESAFSLQVTARAKIVYSVGSALQPSPLAHGASTGVPDLQFISEAHIRDHGALPLAGTRLYYLSLFSDDYPAEWEPVQREPLTPVARATPWAEWNRRRRFCTDIFLSNDGKLHTIREVNVLTSSSHTRKKRSASEMEADESESSEPSLVTASPPPPMIGIVQFKSALAHTGAPNVVNAFPFMFHIILADRERMVAIAFFGSMAAKHFLVLQEGDVVQLQGYTVSRSAARENEKSKKLFVFPHMSTGVVSHVPDKYWQLLEAMQVLAKRPRASRRERGRGPVVESTVWLQPTFWNTRDTQRIHLTDEDAQQTHFDFVGVATFVSRTHRDRPLRDHSINANTVAALTAYRWVKLIDTRSTHELVVQLFVNSQPTAFHALQAGDTVLLSKLRWVRPHPGVAFATSSPFTTIRLNDAVEPYQIFSECFEIVQFAKTLQANGGSKTQYAPLGTTTESWLEGAAVRDYEPVYPVVAMADSVEESLAMLAAASVADAVDDPRRHWIPTFAPDDLGLYPFEDVAAIAESMDAMAHEYIRVHVALHDIRAAPVSANTVSDIEFVVTDSERQDDRAPRPLRLRSNVLFRERNLPSPLDELVATEAEPLARLLTPSALASLNTASILRATELPRFSPAKAPPRQSLASDVDEPQQPQITLATVKEYILKNRQGAGVGGIDVALHLYRLPQGGLDLWIDGIHLEG